MSVMGISLKALNCAIFSDVALTAQFDETEKAPEDPPSNAFPLASITAAVSALTGLSTLKVAMPATAFVASTLSAEKAVVELLIVTRRVSLTTILPLASWICTATAGLIGHPSTAAVGWVQNTNLLGSPAATIKAALSPSPAPSHKAVITTPLSALV